MNVEEIDRFEVALALMKAFPCSFVNQNGEFIANAKSNTYFCLGNCRTLLDVQCKILEWISRAAHKTQVFVSEKRNKDFHAQMRLGINSCLGTQFTEEDISRIYDNLGNAINHELTVEFVKSGYDMSLLPEE